MQTFPGLLFLIAWFGATFPAAVWAQNAPSAAPPKPASHALLASDINARALWDGRKEVAFHASTLPGMVKAARAHFLIDEEYVLGITKNGESRAYPTRFISWHHIVNDRIGTDVNGAPSYVTMTYCIVCNSGICFETPLIEHKPLQFDFYGLYNGVMTFYDKNTNSVWLQVTGRAVRGPLCEMRLKTMPVLNTTWGEWKKLHPDTLVMTPDPHLKDAYEAKGSVMVRGYDAFPADYFRPTLTHRDTRLPMFESVLAVSLPAVEPPPSEAAISPLPIPALQRAYPLKAFHQKTGVINDRLGSTPIAVLYQSGSETVNAFSPLVDGRTLTLEARKTGRGRFAFFDRETDTRWSIEGVGEAGPLQGRQMTSLDSHMSQWYGWVSYFPETSVYSPPRIAVSATRSSTAVKIGKR